MRPARPRPQTASPAYPTLAALGTLVAVTSCANSQKPPSETPVTATVAAQPAAPEVALEPEGPEPILTAGVTFPEDDAPLNENDVACLGDCPSPFVMAVHTKDRGQVEARIRYCAKAVEKRGSYLTGTINVTGQVSAEGVPSDIDVTLDGGSDEVLDCVRTLVRSAKFTGDFPYERRLSVGLTLDEK